MKMKGPLFLFLFVNRKWKLEATLFQTILLSDIQFCKKFYVVFNDFKKETSDDI